MNEIIWAYGPMVNGEATAHGTTDTDRGGLNNFYVIQLPAAARYLTMSISVGLAAILAFF